MKALKWQLMQSKLSVLMPSFITLAEHFGKWRPYLELFGGQRKGGRIFTGGGLPWSPLEPPLFVGMRNTRRAVPESGTGSSERSICEGDRTRRTHAKMIEGWRPDTSGRHLNAVDRTDIDVQCREDLGRQWPPCSLNLIRSGARC